MFAVWQDFNPNTSFPAPWVYFRFCIPFIDCCQYSLSNLTFSPPTSINNPIALDDDDDNSNESSTAIAGLSSLSTSDTGRVTATLVLPTVQTCFSDLLLINTALFSDENDRLLSCGHTGK
jgi:hypothetical protein